MSKKKIQSSSTPKAYSYIRFSTAEQEFGDSERRQLEGARRFAEREGLHLDDSFKMIDKGLSGFKGKNVEHGALGVFLAAIDKGLIARGSVLIVEHVDRISRTVPKDAIKLILFGILDKGVHIQTLSPERRYTEESINNHEIYFLIAQIHNAYEESRKKSERISCAWQNKRDYAVKQKKGITRLAPKWLQCEGSTEGRFKSYEYQIIPSAQATIRQIFEWRAKGIGVQSIVKYLNDPKAGHWKPPACSRTPPGASEKIKQPKKGSTNDWGHSYVNKILISRAVIGEYQLHRMVDGKRVPVGEPIPKYFPAIVSPGLFEKVQKLHTRNKDGSSKGGRTGKYSNLLRYLAICPYCGSRMSYEDKGEPPKGGRYLVCRQGSRNRSKCDRNTFRYEQIETLILDTPGHSTTRKMLTRKRRLPSLASQRNRKVAGRRRKQSSTARHRALMVSCLS